MARPRSDIAPRIVQAARKRFLANGVDGASLREIASAAKTSIGMVYYYYPTKDDLFLAVVEEVYVKLIDELGRVLGGSASTPLEERVEKLYQRFHEMSDDEVTVMRIVVRELLTSTARRQKLIERFLRGHIPVVFGAVMEGKRRGEVAERLHPMPVTLAMMLMGFFPALIMRLAGPSLPPAVRPPDGSALAAQLVEILFHGVKGRSARG